MCETWQTGITTYLFILVFIYALNWFATQCQTRGDTKMTQLVEFLYYEERKQFFPMGQPRHLTLEAQPPPQLHPTAADIKKKPSGKKKTFLTLNTKEN